MPTPAPTPPGGSLTPPRPGSVAVGSLSQARRHKREYDAVITAEDPAAHRNKRLRFHRPGGPAHLVLRFEDVDWDDLGLWTAREGDVAEAVEFAREHAGGSLLVHCYHGVGRSAGLAYAIIADRLGAGSEADALARLLAARPQACPNRMVVRAADAVLGRGGALTAALDDWEAGSASAGRRRAYRRSFIEKNLGLYARAPWLAAPAP